jgi:hypothetical protein
MSLGILVSQDWDLQPVEEILVEVDRALYRAKDDGRNCVKLAKPNAVSDLSDQLVKLRNKAEE